MTGAGAQLLEGTRVVDLTRAVSGPYAAMLLGDLGADVIRVEDPLNVDAIRTFPPLQGGESHYHLSINRSKRSVLLDLKSPGGRAVLLDLVRVSDVVLENYRPGVMARLGLDYAALSAANPRVVCCSISGFGQDGPLRDKTAFDLIVQAMSGAMSMNGVPDGPPVRLAIPIGDLAAGLFAVIGILTALHERAQTGRGQDVDVSMFDGMLGLLGHLAGHYFVTGDNPPRVGSSHSSAVPYGVFPTRDGFVAVAVYLAGFWPKFCQALERPDLIDHPDYRTNTARLEHRAALEQSIAAAMRQRPTSEWQARFEDHDVPYAPILSVAEALEHPHARARGMLAAVHHRRAGLVRMVGRVLKFPRRQGRAYRPPPLLGEHTAEVLAGVLGYDDARLRTLTSAGVFGPDAEGLLGPRGQPGPGPAGERGPGPDGSHGPGSAGAHEPSSDGMPGPGSEGAHQPGSDGGSLAAGGAGEAP